MASDVGQYEYGDSVSEEDKTMPEVGVLELQIRDNAKTAGTGLGSLADAIVAVKTAVGKGLGLGTVGTQVANLAKKINDQQNANSTIKNLSSLFNALSAYSKLKTPNFNMQPIKDLKEAVGNGISLGKAGDQMLKIRESLGGDWNSESAVSGMNGVASAAGIFKSEGTASTLTKVANAIDKYADSLKKLKKNGIMEVHGGGMSLPVENSFTKVPVNLGQFGYKSEDNPAISGMKEQIDEGFEYVESRVSAATSSIREFSSSSKDALVASKNIKDLISYLDAGENRKSRGYNHVVDAYTGVSKPLTNLAEESAKAFDDKFFERIDRVDHFFENLNNPKSNMGWSSEAFDKILGVGHEMEKISDETSSMFNIPAMDKEGPFKYAYEEIQYYSEKLSEAQTAMNTFDAAAKRIQKDIQYKGSTEARMNELARMEESYYTASDGADRYKEALAGVLSYANQYSETIVETTQTAQEQAAVMGEVTHAAREQAEAIKSVNASAEDSDRLARKLQNIVTLAESWKSISKDQRGDFFNIYKFDPLTSGVLEKLQDLKGDNLGEFAAKIREIVDSSAEGTDKIKRLNDLLQTFGKVQQNEGFANAVHGMNGLASLAESSMGEVEHLVGMSDIELMTMKLDALKHALAEDISSGRLDSQQMAERAMTIKHLTEKIEGLKEAQDGLNNRVRSGKSGWDSFTDGLKKAFPLIERIKSQLGRIILRRALTAMIRQIASGFKEGVQNVYEYSKAVGTDFAPAMDAAASSIAQMKNSIGAAVAPAIQALIPLLQTVVSWFITAVNYVNQFFALLNGQSTWTRALPQTVKAFDNQKKAAKGAANAMKDLLADWDELNIIQSNTTGGAGGGTAQAAEDYLNMFEEVDRFDDKVKDIMGFLYDNFDNLKRAAIDVGAAILGWKIGSAFTGLLGALGKIATTVAVIDLSLRLTDAFGKQFVNTGDIGWFIADALTGAIGPLLAGKAASSLLGAAWGSIAAGFTLMLEGEVNLKNSRSAWAQRLVSQAQMLALLGSVEQGIGAALIAAGFSASAPVAIAIGGATALFAYTVNALAAVNITGVKWGDDTLTPAQVEEYVKENMLGVDIDSTIKITKASIELAEGEETKLSEKANGLIAPLNVLKLGVDVEGSLDQIKNGVFGEEGLLAQFKAYTSAQKELVNTAETYAPTIDAEGRNISGDIISDASNVWKDLNGIMDELGADLSRHLARSMDTTLSDELRQFELNAVEEITDTMIRVTLAGKRASASSDALTDLAFNLKEASAGTFEDILSVYSNYKDQLTEELQAIKKEEASSWANASAMYEELAKDALEKAGGDTNDSLYQEYKSKAEHAADEYKKIIEFLDSSVTKAVEEAAAPGKDLLRDALLEKLQGVEELYDGRLALFAEGKVKSLPTGIAGGVKDKVMNAMQDLVLGGFGEGINDTNVEKLKGLYTDWLDSILEEFFPADYGIFKQAIESGVLNYTDFFDPETLFDSMTKTGHNSTLYKQMWDIMFNGLEYSGNVDLEERPIVDMEIVTQAGWVDENGKPLGDDYATVLSTLTSVGEKAHGYDMDYTENAVIHLTPILDDGTVLTPQELDNYISDIVKESLNTGSTIKEVDSGHYSIVLGYDLVPEGMSLEDAYAEAKKWDEKLHEAQADMYDSEYEAIVQAEIEIANAESIKEEIRQQIEDALSGTRLDPSQEDALLNGLIGTFGSDFEDYILETFEELEKDIGSNGGIAGKINPNRITAAGAFSDTRPSRSYVNGRPAAEVQMDQQSMTNAVESGTKKANAVEEDLIRQLVRVVEQIARKDFTVNVSPSAAWGGMNVKSGIARARVTGAIPMEE